MKNDTFAQNPDVTTTISPAQITKIPNAGTAVVLQEERRIFNLKCLIDTGSFP